MDTTTPSTRMMTLFKAGLATAVIDCAFATVLSVGFFGSTFMRLWQGVASVPLGRDALERGATTMWIGLGLHLCVAFWWSFVFVYGLIRIPIVQRVLASPFGPLKVAALYGPMIWLVMTLVVIPAFTKRPPTFAPRWWIQLVGHIPFVGLPMAWVARSCQRLR